MESAEGRVLLQVGFGLGEAFLHVWHRCAEGDPPLHFIALTRHPPTAEALRQAHRGSALQPLADELAALWPPLTPNLHLLSVGGARVQLLLGVGEPLHLLPQLQARVHEMRVDEFDAAQDPTHALRRLARGLARLAAPQATLQAPARLQALQPALAAAGFAVAPGTDELRATYQPAFQPRGRQARPGSRPERHALIVGAGLAGCATAWALAGQGWRSTLIDRADAPANQGSGNPAGLFHGIVTPQDGAHARFNRAAALLAQRTVQRAVASGMVRGSASGLLRLDTRGLDASVLNEELARLQLPADYVQALDAASASERCGLRLRHPAWFYPGGGWVQPAVLARWMLQQAGDAVHFRGSLDVQTLAEREGRWQLLDATGKPLAEGRTVVLANASNALRLAAATHWPVQSVRGQISVCTSASSACPRTWPRLPIAGAGYLLPELDGEVLFGASAHPGDQAAELREADHRFNLQRLALLSPEFEGWRPDSWSGRVGWRCVSDDRLPLVGAVPDESALAGTAVERLDQVPRRTGLFMFSALGSRGISWAALGAQVLAARISGAPVPLESSLLEALDPARFALRSARRAPRG